MQTCTLPQHVAARARRVVRVWCSRRSSCRVRRPAHDSPRWQNPVPSVVMKQTQPCSPSQPNAEVADRSPRRNPHTRRPGTPGPRDRPSPCQRSCHRPGTRHPRCRHRRRRILGLALPWRRSSPSHAGLVGAGDCRHQGRRSACQRSCYRPGTRHPRVQASSSSHSRPGTAVKTHLPIARRHRRCRDCGRRRRSAC